MTSEQHRSELSARRGSGLAWLGRVCCLWGSCRFREFAVAELQRSGVADLAQVQRGQKRAASARNVAYIQERRGDLRATLRAAARNGWLPFTQTTMRGRNSSASRQAQYVSLLSDDDD